MSKNSTDRKYGVRTFLGAAIFLVAAGLVATDATTRLGGAGPDVDIAFSRGVTPSGDFDNTVAEVVRRLEAENDLIVVLRGHTGTLGESDVNKDLGRRRAQAVKDSLVDRGVTPGRISVVAVGGSEPLEQTDGESGRAFQRRLARVQAVFKFGGAQ